jgi:hypothetical protein
VAKSDQYRSELETRQADLRLQQLKKQIRIEVRNAQYALEQSEARVAAVKGRRRLRRRPSTLRRRSSSWARGRACRR